MTKDILVKNDFTSHEWFEIQALGDWFSYTISQERLMPRIGDENTRNKFREHIRYGKAMLAERQSTIEAEAGHRKAFRKAGINV